MTESNTHPSTHPNSSQVLTTQWREERLCGWGRYPYIRTQSTYPSSIEMLSSTFRSLINTPQHQDSCLAHGLGRSYGDSCLVAESKETDGASVIGKTLHTRALNQVISFDQETGWVTCEAGVSIYQLIQTFLPQGYFPPVVPGTQFVTVGGALCNDIHGKNHHVDGTFADHVRNVNILTASGELMVCDAQQHSELFWATVGGLGLTGLILSLELKLIGVEGPGIEMESIRVRDLDHFFEVSAESDDYTHTVSWIDCVAQGSSLGRGIFMRGRHSSEAPKPRLLGRVAAKVSPLLNVPFSMPNLMLNPLSIRAFNELYYRKHPKGSLHQIVGYEPFFFPLDFVRNWNRIYGRRGFLQYQLVVPKTENNQAIRQILEEITATGMGSFLAVIKEFGSQTHGGLSFPRPGVTLALDFPHYGTHLLALFERLDRIVIEAGGRVYLGKDARLPRDHFQQMYPEWQTWRTLRDQWDPHGVFRSQMSDRLGLTSN